MPTPHVPTFSSPDLQKAVARARETLEGREEIRNKVSNDVRQLEAYLESLRLTEAFRLPLGKCFVDSEDDHGRSVAAALEYGGSASGQIQEEALGWLPDAHGRFRLMHELTLFDGGIDVDLPGGPLFWDDTTAKRTVKPLIETKFEVRKQVLQHLPDFVSALAAYFADPTRFDSEAGSKAGSGENDLPF